MIPESLRPLWLRGLARTKMIAYSLQGATLPLWESVATGSTKPLTRRSLQDWRFAIEDLDRFVAADAELVVKGIFPANVLMPDPSHLRPSTYLKFVLDGFELSERKQKKQTKYFDGEANLKERGRYPAYYLRNFHFQKNGYLSEKSAELYDVQVEILFGGAADAMRRIAYPELIKQGLAQRKALRVVDFGAGTGRSSLQFQRVFPRARMTLVDLSEPYLNYARRTHGMKQWNYCVENTEDTSLPAGQFDVVQSVFQFHELPKAARLKTLQSARRLLKPGKGLMVFVDALQKGDRPEFQAALNQFPREFHEPFFKDYVATPMEGLMNRAGFEVIAQGTGFLSKFIIAKHRI